MVGRSQTLPRCVGVRPVRNLPPGLIIISGYAGDHESGGLLVILTGVQEITRHGFAGSVLTIWLPSVEYKSLSARS